MLTYLLLGGSFGFAAAVQPGQFQAYLVSQTMKNGWRRTIPATLAPLLSDLPIVALVLVVLTRMPQSLLFMLQIAGGLFLLYLAWGAFRAAQDYEEAVAHPDAVHRTILKAALVNLLNPNPYLSWGLIMGPLLLKGWREAPARGIALVAAFYVTLIVCMIGVVLLVAAARSLGPRIAKSLVFVSALALAGFGIYQLWEGTTGWMQVRT